MLAAVVLLTVKERGIVVADPPCCLGALLSSSYHKRKQGQEAGDESKVRVRMSNLIVRNLAALLNLAFARDVFWVTDQPSTSTMWFHRPMEH